jgi:lysophospholipase L1-like esterase
MRSSALFALLLAAAAAVALLVARHVGDERAPAGGTVALVGDSLNVGVEPYIGSALPGFEVIANDRVGRRTEEGIDEIEQGRARLAPHVVVSLGTNDPPSDVGAFRAAVERVTELVGPGRCLVWATIWRDAAPNDALNRVLRDAAAANRRMRLVEWAEMVQAHPDWLAPDRLHGSDAGYRERARAIAAAVRDCAPARSLEGS